MSKKHWWQRSKIKALLTRPNWYRLSCPYCRINFYIDEDWPSRMQIPEEMLEEYEEVSPIREYYGLTIFEVFCPACGQILRFDRTQTPVGKLQWKRNRNFSAVLEQ